MSKYDAVEEEWERPHPRAEEYEDEEFDEDFDRRPRRQRLDTTWWSGRVAVAIALCAVGAVALGFTIVGVAGGDSKSAAYPALPSVAPPTSSVTAAPPTTAEAREIVVSVVGAVRQPGLARLVPGARVADAIAAAGGLSPEAEASGLNLAQRLEDGDQVVVGAEPTPVTPTAVPPAPPRKTPPAPYSQQAADPRAGSRCECGGNRAPGSSPSGRKQTNVNTATEAELDAVPGIGKGIARAIVQYRAAHGRVRSLDELAKIKQVGAGRLKKLRPYLRV